MTKAIRTAYVSLWDEVEAVPEENKEQLLEILIGLSKLIKELDKGYRNPILNPTRLVKSSN